MIQKIIDVHHPVLRQKARPVLSIDKKIHSLIADMRDTLAAQDDPEGVGLAAPQVGKSLKLFIVNYKELDRVIINPQVIDNLPPRNAVKQGHKSRSIKPKEQILEGCLSLPFYYGPITRQDSITIKYTNETGKEITETFEDFHAHIIQHEIDHLDGTLFIDHILKQNSKLYYCENDEWEEVKL
jgi:peptide deformylase